MRKWLNTGESRTLTALVVFAVSIRAFTFIDTEFGIDVGPSHALYVEALLHHAAEYLAYAHNMAIGVVLRDWLFIMLAGADRLAQGLSLLALAAGVGTTVLTYLSCRRLEVSMWLAVVVAVFVSVRMLAMETPNASNTWDNPVPFLLTLYIFAVVNVVQERGSGYIWLAGLAGGLVSIILQSAAPLIFGSALLVLMFRGFKDGNTFLSVGIRLFSIPILIVGLAIAKNAGSVGVYAVSSGAGENILQNVNMSLPSERGLGALDYAERKGYPHWWRWCFEEAERRGKWKVVAVSGYYGACAHDAENRYDFGALHDYLLETGETRLAAIVTKDAKDAIERPWLFSGPTPTRATRFAAEYGKISQQLFFDVLRDEPRALVGRFIRNTDNIRLAFADYLVPGTGTLKLHERFGSLFRSLMLPLLIVAMVPVVVLPGIFMWRYVRGEAARRLPEPVAFGCWIVSLLVFGNVFISLAISCCDNARHAFNFLPLMVIVAAYVVQRIVSSIAARRPHG